MPRSPLENLRRLSSAHRKRVDKAEAVAANMKANAEAAQKAAQQAKAEKG